MLFAALAELPPYRIVVNSRARRARLKVSPVGEVEVVVPSEFPQHWVSSFVYAHREWLLETLNRIHVARARWHGNDPAWPEEVSFRHSGERWRVLTQPTVRSGVQAGDGVLQVRGKDMRGRQQALQRWLSRAATARLAPALEQLAGELGAAPERLQVRQQRSRWGSCSSRGHIQLNRALVFLPTDLVRYVLIHELCHLQHPNHSRRFWGRVAEADTNWRQHDRAMRSAWDFVPRWALPFPRVWMESS